MLFTVIHFLPSSSHNILSLLKEENQKIREEYSLFTSEQKIGSLQMTKEVSRKQK